MWFFNKKKQDQLIQSLQKQDDQNYWAIVRRQFVKNRLAVWSLRFFMVIVFIAVFADFIANEKPIYCSVKITQTKENGQTEEVNKIIFPIIHQYFVDFGLAKWDPAFLTGEWNAPKEGKFEYNFVIFPPITYLPQKTDVSNSTVGPWSKQQLKKYKRRHFLGTDHMGRDVASGMIHGTRIAMLVGLVSMSIATFIGILLGSMAGYFGDERLKMPRIGILLNILGLFGFIFFAFVIRGYQMGDNIGNGYMFYEMIFNFGLFFVVIISVNLLASLFKNVPWVGTPVTIPIDIIVMRMIEIVTSIPLLILILAILAIILTAMCVLTVYR